MISLLTYIAILGIMVALMNFYSLYLLKTGKEYYFKDTKVIVVPDKLKSKAFSIIFDFSNSIFFTEKLRNSYYQNELFSIKMHEDAHQKKKHGFILGFIQSFIIAIPIISFINDIPIFAIIASELTIISVYILISRHFEYQADTYVFLKGHADNFFKTLIDRDKSKYNILHPSTEKRILKILSFRNNCN